MDKLCISAVCPKPNTSKPAPGHKVYPYLLKAAGVRISMDGKGRWLDNVFIERLWRSLKYEEVYLKAYENVAEAREGIGAWIEYYNSERRHKSLNRLTPDVVYSSNLPSGDQRAA